MPWAPGRPVATNVPFQSEVCKRRPGTGAGRHGTVVRTGGGQGKGIAAELLTQA